MSKSIEEIKTTVKAYVIKEFFDEASASELTDTTPLISGGIMDSISTIQMVDFLEKEYKIEFQAHEVDQDNLNTIDLIANFVIKRIG